MGSDGGTEEMRFISAVRYPKTCLPQFYTSPVNGGFPFTQKMGNFV
jgi:hypothetical protein